MIRNTALLTLLVFTFTLFAPVFIQPKEAVAGSTCSTCNIDIGQVIESIGSGLEAVYDVCSGFLNAAGKHIHNKIFKHNRCSKCSSTSCSGQSTSECPLSDTPAGCGEKNIWYCEDHNGYECDNISCQNHGTQYRNCTGGHTCTPISSSSSSGSYW